MRGAAVRRGRCEVRSAIAAAALVMAAGCGMPGADFEPLYSLQPYVVSVEPTDGAEVGTRAMVAVEFSIPVDPASVGRGSLAIMRADEGDDAASIADDLTDGDCEGARGVYEFAGGNRVAIFRAAEPYEPGAEYAVVATGGITTEDALPLNQRPGSAPEPFMSRFRIASGTGDGPASGGGAQGGGDAAPRDRPAFLVINEILYDVVGSDAEGDLFVELCGEAGKDVSGYRVIFINGADGAKTETIELPEGARVPDDGIFLIADSRTGEPGETDVPGADLVDNFDPQNGPDCVELVGDGEALLDALGYGSPIISPAADGSECVEGTPAMKATSGQSLSRSGCGDSGDNSADFQLLSSPTPGVQ
jgi:hypothetical protein